MVHISGHGSQDGLCFRSANGDARIVSPEAVAETFGVAGTSVKLVVMSACYSEAPAEALLAHVDCVVGTGSTIHHDATRCFVMGFYGGIAEREPVAVAYKQGRAAINLEGWDAGDRPHLKARAGIDSGKLVLAA